MVGFSAGIGPGILTLTGSGQVLMGVSSHHLCTELLKEKAKASTPTLKAQVQAGHQAGSGGNEVGIQFNHGLCSYGLNCNIKHVHMLCQLAHPQTDHCPQQMAVK